MRNLKKFLALALAMIMALSVMSIASAKTYSDSDSVTEKYAEAVQVLTGLEVFQGYSDSTFQPQGNITRAEVAAIIYRVVTGDVSDGNVGLYADYDKFDDVTSTDWFAGYVNYCANAEYVKGVGGNKFNPKGNVTGYEVLAMILRAVGYDQNDEFTGADWKVKVASTARELNITDTVSEVTLGKAVTREVVAELLFRTIAKVPTVTYTSALGYNQYTSINGTTKNPTLGEKTFSLVSIDGVVTANEYADLYGTTALAAGKTEIDGTVYAVSTELTDIGESRVGWAYGKSKTVVYLADSGLNTVFQTGAETDLTNFKKVTGLTDAAEDFINFGDSYDNNTYAGIRIVYSIDGTNVRNSFAPGTVITSAQLAEIRAIFYGDDYADGWVLVGTTFDTAANAQANDVSNTMKYSTFVTEYLTSGSTKLTNVTGSVNGDWLKVIDNDGDGKAEYVFKTEAVMAKVVSLTSKGVLTLTDCVISASHADDETAVFGGTGNTPFTTEDELAAGDVVLYTVIDGTCYVQLAESFTGTVDKYTYKTNVLTVEGEDYEESGIEEHTGLNYLLQDAEKKTEYTYYKDWFGYIRAYALPADAAGSLVLLTDGFFQTGRTQNVYAVAAYLDGTIGDYDVADNDAGFLTNAAANNSSNAWGHLTAYVDDNVNTKTTNVQNGNGDPAALTNVARYTKDGTTLTLSEVKTYTTNGRGVATGIATDYVDLDEDDLTAGQRTYDGVYVIDTADVDGNGNHLYNVDGATAAEETATAGSSAVRVQANNSTVYYYVTYLATGTVVTTVTGYKNSLAVDDATYGINAIYAVATNTHNDAAGTAYWVADVIVVETATPVAATNDSVVLGYNLLNKTVKDFGDLEVVTSTAALSELDVVSVDHKAAGTGVTIEYNGVQYTDVPTPVFYVNAQVKDSDDSYLTTIQSNFGAHGIFVATTDRVNKLDDYVVALDAAHTELSITSSTVVYEISNANKGNKKANVITDEDADGNKLVIETNERYVIYANADNEIIYAVKVGTNGVMSDLYTAIYNDANGIVVTPLVGDYTVTANAGNLTSKNADNSLEDTDTLGGANISLGNPDTGKEWQVNSITMGGVTISNTLYTVNTTTGAITFTGVAATALVTGNIVIDAEQVAAKVTVTVTITQTTNGTDDVTIASAKVGSTAITGTAGTNNDTAYEIDYDSTLVLTVTPDAAFNDVTSTKGTVAVDLSTGNITVTYSNVQAATSDTLTGATNP